MFKRIWYLIFNKKEKIMATTTTAHLEQQVSQQRSEIARLKGRISTLSEDLNGIKRDIADFRRRVTDDMTALVENIQEERKKR
jgi:predicted  nucleic acid-binding Zn-ribbon protein